MVDLGGYIIILMNHNGKVKLYGEILFLMYVDSEKNSDLFYLSFLIIVYFIKFIIRY